MRNILNQIKWAYQRVVRGYDDRIKWGFDEYFILAITPLEEFCDDYLKSDTAKYNKKRCAIYRETLKRIKKYSESDMLYDNTDLDNLFSYVGKHISWYWD